MSTKPNHPSRISRYYQVTVEGKIEASWADWLNGMQLVSWQDHDGKQLTTLSGVLADQAALRGLLIRLWDLNLILRSLQQTDPTKISQFK